MWFDWESYVWGVHPLNLMLKQPLRRRHRRSELNHVLHLAEYVWDCRRILGSMCSTIRGSIVWSCWRRRTSKDEWEPDSQVDGTWQVIANGFSGAANTVQIAINNVKNSVQGDNPRLWADEVTANANITMEFSNSNWKEFGVLGAEAIRTNTAAIGDY